MNNNKKKFSKPQLSKVEELTKALYKVSKELDEKNILLEKQNEKLIKDERTRKDMYSNLSHDLRSPINAIRNSIEYILSMDKYNNDEDIKEMLVLIDDRTKSMEKLINQIFLLSRIDNDSVNMNKQTINVSDFIEEIYYSTIGDNRYSSRKISMNVPQNLDVSILVDPDQLARVFDNLLSNSLKYSCEDDRIEIGVIRCGNDSKKIIMYVSDDGIGIEKEDIEHIFERSYVASKSRTPKKDNSFGIGLAIVKGIVELHGGRVWCESKIGEGTAVFVELDTDNN